MKLNLTFPVILVLGLFAFNGEQERAIHLDGVISKDEWLNAKEYALAGGGKLFLHQDGSVLFVAMKADKNSWSHVYLAVNDTIRVMHASAALGEAVYTKSNNLWRPVKDFQWDLRDRVYNKDMQGKQEDYFTQHHWVANNNNTGDGKTFEFMIDLSGYDNVSFACLVLDDPSHPHYYPRKLNDNTILPRLTQGYAPDSLHFSPGEWEQMK